MDECERKGNTRERLRGAHEKTCRQQQPGISFDRDVNHRRNSLVEKGHAFISEVRFTT